jgi:hypothetical protein
MLPMAQAETALGIFEEAVTAVEHELGPKVEKAAKGK